MSDMWLLALGLVSLMIVLGMGLVVVGVVLTAFGVAEAGYPPEEEGTRT